MRKNTYLIIVTYLFCLAAFISCSITEPKETSSKSIQELNKILGLKFSGISAKWMKVKLAANGDDNPFCIRALITLNNKDTMAMNTLTSNENDIRNSISIDNKTIHSQLFEKVKKHCVKNSIGLYYLKVPAYSTKRIIKNPFLKGYFVPLERNVLFLTVCSDR